MANPAIKKVTVDLDRERTVIFNLNAMVDFEEATGQSLLKGKIEVSEMSVKSLRALLWACLHQDDKDLTPQRVGEIISAENLDVISSALSRAFGASMPEPTGEAKGEGQDPTTPPIG